MQKFPYITVAIVACVTIVAGILHGNMTDRWGISDDGKKAGELIEQLPEKFGNWELQEEGREMSGEARKQLRCHGYAYGTYVNPKTGKSASIAFLLGPPGPIAVHTPEICFSSRDFKATGKRKPITIETNGGEKSRFWSLGFKSTRIDASDIQVVYAWNGGKGWTASKSPRWEYSGSPYLYKLQIVCPANDPTSGQNPCEQFLKEFLPVANQHVQFAKSE